MRKNSEFRLQTDRSVAHPHSTTAAAPAAVADGKLLHTRTLAQHSEYHHGRCPSSSALCGVVDRELRFEGVEDAFWTRIMWKAVLILFPLSQVQRLRHNKQQQCQRQCCQLGLERLSVNHPYIKSSKCSEQQPGQDQVGQAAVDPENKVQQQLAGELKIRWFEVQQQQKIRQAWLWGVQEKHGRWWVVAGGAAAAFEHAAMSLPQPLPCPQAAAIDLQDLAVGAWGHGMINEAFQSSAEHQQQQGGMMIDQYLHTLNSSSSLPPFNYTNLQEAVEKTLESSLGSVCDKVWNNNNRVTADYHQFGHVMAGADYSLITNPMGSMFHSISTGSLMYLQNKTCCYSEAQVMTKLPPPSQTSLQEIQKAGGPLTLASLPDPSLMKNITSAANDDDDDDASSEVKNYTNNSTVSSVQKQQLQNGNNCQVGNSLVPQPGLYVSSTTAVESSCETLEASKLPAGNQTWTFTETSSEISSSNKTQNSNPPGKVKVCSEEQQQHQNFSNGFQRTPPVDQPVSITKWLPQIVALPPPGPPPLLPLEAKRALPPKCALPPLTVVKCALPRSTNHGRVASNARKRPLWPANTNNMINGSPKKKPIAKWPGVELGCSRLEAVSTLAHHTVTQNTSNYNARALGPALNTNLKPRARQGSANDPQSIAARVRRERISERLKALQLLVPNGDKVDMVTMLEKAINYVQCLELQIRMLKDDTLWPKALGALPNTLQEFLELAGPELAALQEEEQKRKKKRMESVIKEDDPMSSPSPSSDNNTE